MLGKTRDHFKKIRDTKGTCHAKMGSIKDRNGMDFILGGSKITADGDCSHEIQRRLFLGRKTMTNLEKLKKRKRK